VLYERFCNELGVQSDAAAFDYLVEHLHRSARRPLLACYPRDLLTLVVAHASYREEPAVATPDTLQRAWNSYFATSGVVEPGADKPDKSMDVIRMLVQA
jgi:hypothetical protein